jgi:hypothetical protein
VQLTWIPSRRRFVGTQTEAKAEKAAFEVEEVPVVKADLIAYLNAREERHEAEVKALRTRIDELEGDGGAEAAVDAAQPMAPIPANGDLVDQVLELDERTLVRVLGAAIGRLGEVAGTRGWSAFAKDTYGWTPAARSVEQGLGMLMLAAFDSFGMDPDASGKRRLEPIAPPDKAEAVE